MAALEILHRHAGRVANLIREGKTFQIPSIMQTGRAKGMVALHDAPLDLVKRGLVEPREAWLKAIDKEALAKAFAANGIALGEPSWPPERPGFGHHARPRAIPTPACRF